MPYLCSPDRGPGGVTKRIVMVCGPPGAGKSSYVQQRAKWGDLILDMDALYQALSGLAWYTKPEGLLPYVLAAEAGVIDVLTDYDNDVRAWIITGGADRRKRQALVNRLGATLVMLATPPGECIRRIQNDERRKDKAHLWESIVAAWWSAYQG